MKIISSTKYSVSVYGNPELKLMRLTIALAIILSSSASLSSSLLKNTIRPSHRRKTHNREDLPVEVTTTMLKLRKFFFSLRTRRIYEPSLLPLPLPQPGHLLLLQLVLLAIIMIGLSVGMITSKKNRNRLRGFGCLRLELSSSFKCQYRRSTITDAGDYDESESNK